MQFKKRAPLQRDDAFAQLLDSGAIHLAENHKYAATHAAGKPHPPYFSHAVLLRIRLMLLIQRLRKVG
jgi:hypothetical protein